MGLRFTFPALASALGKGSFVLRPGRPVERKALTVPEVAAEIGASEQQVSNLIEGGNIEAFNVGDGKRQHWRIRVEALEKFLQARSSLNV